MKKKRRDRRNASLNSLVDKLHEESWQTREAAAEALNGARSLLAIMELGEALLRDKHPLVRVAAAEALGNSRVATATEVLEYALTHDRDYLVRAYAAEAIAQCGGPKVIATIRNALKEETSDRVRLSMFFALATLGEKGQLVHIAKFLDSRRYATRCAAAESLTECATPKNTPRIAKALERRLVKERALSVRSRIVDCLGDLGISPSVLAR